ncbi:MAG: hypothetical protein QG567_723, partial [Campylobacterota bacterium]|nr:hypothetical protein [Campylobacterota bacterium]
MKEKDKELLADLSLKGDGFSSLVHAQELIAQEASRFHLEDEFVIPFRYGVDVIKILPVNLDTVFAYWEITNNLLKDNKVSIENIIAKIFILEKNSENEICEFFIKDEVGSLYLKVSAPMQKVIAKVGFYDKNGVFIVLLASSTIVLPNNKIEQTDDEIWMSKDEIGRAH